MSTKPPPSIGTSRGKAKGEGKLGRRRWKGGREGGNGREGREGRKWDGKGALKGMAQCLQNHLHQSELLEEGGRGG